MNKEKKSFAFKLASIDKDTQPKRQAVEGVSHAGCSASRPYGILRYPSGTRGDYGMYC